MDPINILQNSSVNTRELKDKKLSQQEDVSMEFERIFARQMIEQMTKNMFDNSGSEGILKSGTSMYKEQITDVLADAFAEQEPLKIAQMMRNYWASKTDSES
jgi:Rod binding domain-containing protein